MYVNNAKKNTLGLIGPQWGHATAQWGQVLKYQFFPLLHSVNYSREGISHASPSSGGGAGGIPAGNFGMKRGTCSQ